MKKLVFSVSILIPIAGLKTIKETIESVMHQEFIRWEILILRNSIQDLPQDTDIIEKDVFYQDHLIREIYIREKGKGNVINKGISRAKNDLICVLDADCVVPFPVYYTCYGRGSEICFQGHGYYVQDMLD